MFQTVNTKSVLCFILYSMICLPLGLVGYIKRHLHDWLTDAPSMAAVVQLKSEPFLVSLWLYDSTVLWFYACISSKCHGAFPLLWKSTMARIALAPNILQGCRGPIMQIHLLTARYKIILRL